LSESLFRRAFFTIALFLLFIVLITLPSVSRAQMYKYGKLYFDPGLEAKALRQFFGNLRGSYIEDNQKLSEQILPGLEVDCFAHGEPIILMPSVGDDRYLDTGRESSGFTLYSALIMTKTGRVVSAAMLLGNGLTIFVRDKSEERIAISAFTHWAHEIEMYQGWISSENVKVILLTGYGDRSIN